LVSDFNNALELSDMSGKKFNMSLPSEFNGSCKALKPRKTYKTEGFIAEIQSDRESNADVDRNSTPMLANF
jgi:hypothetical protein